MQPEPNNNISVRQMSKILRKLSIHDGDILALKYQTPTANQDAIEAITHALERMELFNVLVVVVNDFNDLSVLNETEMQKRGWFKLKTLTKMMKLPEREQ